MINVIMVRAMYDLREQVEAKVHRLPLSYFDRTQRGELISRVTNDIDNITQTMQQSLSSALTSVLTVIGVLVMMFSISWQLSLVALVALPLMGVIFGVIGPKSQAAFGIQWKKVGRLNARVEESFSGHALVKVFGREKDASEKFRAENEELYEAAFKAQFLAGVIMPGMMFVGNLSYVGIAVLGGLMVASGQLRLGDVQAFIQYSQQFTQPLAQLGGMAAVVQSGTASAERVFELIDADEQGGRRRRRARGRRGPRRDRVRPRVVLVLARAPAHPRPVVPRRARPDGRDRRSDRRRQDDAREPHHAVLRARRRPHPHRRAGHRRAHATRRPCRTGMVLQDPWLFGGFIRENIRYGRESATDDEIVAAAKATYVDRFVHSLPDGYDTVLDEEASNVSAGEKQLITIARVRRAAER